MSKKAFTLVEIMGVIIIIGVIALITTPIVSYIIEEMRIGAFRSGLHGVFRTTEYYYKQNSFEEFPSMGLEVTSEKVELKNKIFVSGKVVKDKEGNLYLKNVTNNRYCGNGIITNLRITKGDCSDLTIPENLSITVLEEGINKIKVSGYYEEDGYIRRIEFGIREKETSEYAWHESIKDGVPHNIYEFIGLKKNTEYEIGLRVTNENDLSSEAYTEAKTLNIENPYISYKQEWERNKEVSINIPNVESSLKYSYIIVSVDGQVEEAEIKQNDINNHIYKVTITKENETMIIKVIDSSNSNNNYTSIGEVVGYIDVTNPTIEITSISTPTGSNSWYINSPVITITKSDSKSGLKSYQYMISEDGGNTYNGVTTVEDVMNITAVVINKNGSNIKIRIRAIDKVGNYSEYVYTDILKIDTGSITAPVITGGSASFSSTNRTISVSTASTSISGVSKYQYYLSTSSSSQTGGSWLDASGTSQVVSTNGTYYVFFRGISNSGKTSSVSNSQQVRIDNITPTITAKASEYTIIQGTSNALPSTYFNVSTTGASGIASTVCKVGTTTYTNTSNMPGGTHTLTCTTTSGAGKSASASTKVTVYTKSSLSKDFDYTGGVQTYTILMDGVYSLQTWGAQGKTTVWGATGAISQGGKGGYSAGQIYLKKGDVLRVYVGGSGENNGYNGGGSSGTGGYNGGGATDIRFGGTTLQDRIIVAGGGGSAGLTTSVTQPRSGGAGGGVSGKKGSGNGCVGTSTSGFTLGNGQPPIYGEDWEGDRTIVPGGGGGYYGGCNSSREAYWPYGGSGGSAYVGILSNSSMVDGDTSMPNPAGGTITGKTGNGYAKVIFIKSDKGNIIEPKRSTASFGYNGKEQTYAIPQDGVYKFEVWGAQGAGGVLGGKGGYSTGEIYLKKDDILKIYVGGSGAVSGFNGGNGQHRGGGATDIRFGGNLLEHRIIVAGGGGGTVGNKLGGAGGGSSGIIGDNGCVGTQTSGNAFGIGGSGFTREEDNDGSTSYYYYGGGGGGYYGGCSATRKSRYDTGGGGSGGSGYIGTLSNASTIAGNQSTIPNPNGIGSISGNSGHGYVRITFIKVDRGNIVQPKRVTASFNYNGKEQTYTIPQDGVYKFEVWGAQGSGGTLGGKGGYSTGQMRFNKGNILNIYVGGSGAISGFNGGNGQHRGGGATDIRFGGNSLGHRIIVAGGGGGSVSGMLGGAGGGSSGIIGDNGCVGTQTSGNALGIGGAGFTREEDNDGSTSYYYYGGGGGGYYGGCSAARKSRYDTGGSGSGGSGYTGSLTNSYNIAGNLTTMPNFVSGYMTGKEGNGYVIITRVS